jgi:hypothetical protein
VDEQIDDQPIEAYLKSFRPLPPTPLPRPARRWSSVVLYATAASVMVALLLLPLFRSRARVEEPAPITIGSANKLLANSSSWKSTIDDPGFAFRSDAAKVVPGRESALEFLGREDLTK